MSAKQLVYKIEHSLTLPDGRILSAEVLKRVTPGRYHGLMEDCYQEDAELGEWVHRLDGLVISDYRFERLASRYAFCKNADVIETLVEQE